MLPLFFIAGVITVILGIAALVSFLGGIVLWCIARTRFIAPFVTFIPTLAALGAAGGSWGLGYLAVKTADPMSVLPFWAWIVGFPVGGVLGGVLGLLLALLFRRWTRRPNKGAAANRRPALQSDGSGESQRDSCSRSASPAAVAELGRSAAKPYAIPSRLDS